MVAENDELLKNTKKNEKKKKIRRCQGAHKKIRKRKIREKKRCRKLVRPEYIIIAWFTVS